MSKYKAEYIGKVTDKYPTHGGHAVNLFYRYRGHEYMVTDMHNGYSETLAEQHKREQKKIDRIIEEQFNPSIHTEPAEIGLNMFFDYVETGDETVFD